MHRGVPASLLVISSLLVPPVASLGATFPAHPTSDWRSADGPSDVTTRELVQLVNQHRRSLGLRSLTWSPEAAAVAVAHSSDMEHRDFFSHTNPDHASPFDRMRKAKLFYVHAGENIAYGFTSPRELLQAWLDSPGHRKNLENPNYTHHGIGVSGTMWTHVFLAPAPEGGTPVASATGVRAHGARSARASRSPAASPKASQERRGDDRVAVSAR